MEAWDRVAWLAWLMPRMSKETYQFEQFHPLRMKDTRTRLEDLVLTPEERANLPVELTPVETELRWKQWCERNKAKQAGQEE